MTNGKGQNVNMGQSNVNCYWVCSWSVCYNREIFFPIIHDNNILIYQSKREGDSVGHLKKYRS